MCVFMGARLCVYVSVCVGAIVCAYKLGQAHYRLLLLLLLPSTSEFGRAIMD